jgi:1-acyl-sn-glycerol-3-phosphate acyltransferase
VQLSGVEHLPKGPAVICPNHTHKFDFLPLRTVLLHHGMQLMTWIKARDYKSPGMRWILGKGGNVPLVSRGYLIARDFAEVNGRKPTEDEYRQLRAHIDDGAELDARLLGPLQTHRRIAEVDVDPGNGYRTALRGAYRALMAESLRLARAGTAMGRHQHVYPQGATSKQLTPGHPGAVQAALALDIPMVPVGISGCREVFVGKDHPVAKGGSITIAIGPPMSVERDALPQDFRPFDPDHEDRHKIALQAQTDRLMHAINDLCAPSYRWATDLKSDAKQGIARFFT